MQRVLYLYEKDDETRDTIMTTIVTSEPPLSQKLKGRDSYLMFGPPRKIDASCTGACNERTGGSFIDEYCSLFVPIRNLFRHALVCLLAWRPIAHTGVFDKNTNLQILSRLFSSCPLFVACIPSWLPRFLTYSIPPRRQRSSWSWAWETHTHLAPPGSLS